MKTLTYERLFFLGTAYSKDGHERIAISETVEDADSEEEIKELFVKVLGLHEQFEIYRQLITKGSNLAEQIRYKLSELTEVEGYIADLKSKDIDEPDECACNKKQIKAQEKRRNEIKATLATLSSERDTVVMDLHNTKERLGVR